MSDRTRRKQRVLFICTHNSARSQMAEALVRELGGADFEPYSAGTEATEVRPMAIEVMAELGIDISKQESKTLERFLGEQWDHVITVCDDANESCPVFPGATKRSHWSFEDPSKARGTGGERLEVFRRVRDQIAAQVRTFLDDAAAPRSSAA